MMFARGAERRHGSVDELAAAAFRCSRCGNPLDLERVIAAEAERKGHAVTGYVLFRHSCACTQGGTRTTRSWGTHGAFCALFGSQPWLPYEAPFRLQAVADDDPLARRWQWELAQVADVDEFLLFVDYAR